jgi:hypothetical protein
MRAYRRHRADDDQRDKPGNERILDCCDASIVPKETSDEWNEGLVARLSFVSSFNLAAKAASLLLLSEGPFRRTLHLSLMDRFNPASHTALIAVK